MNPKFGLSMPRGVSFSDSRWEFFESGQDRSRIENKSVMHAEKLGRVSRHKSKSTNIFVLKKLGPVLVKDMQTPTLRKSRFHFLVQLLRNVLKLMKNQFSELLMILFIISLV